ncbi:hypothetical protein SAICODRAFT_18651 [Saitoella complicata NRRL Y-17804]|uniref:Large ribosomal subunit protein mL46 n=1 Tax=Saitoella complicata (strain BCRC 22490 / CBS 7301 / JCM 7358 / NBRC 10748 / NRRL Y-17804) TaxID=698492 RepID=A0A0E9NHA4_SAICN|nr:uncharacterized protein SAICODRAFT_18651 [Saitoella complicata NRRL Y-17804]ODQ53612.1 hypothetical protein SAICODRAFT_18651 [Saitoella complicata NRRL Y-17804]GAO48790.1 hypothetical protein G7K_2959-t1 [Saitoella complicata NRRL Y-17804]
MSVARHIRSVVKAESLKSLRTLALGATAGAQARAVFTASKSTRAAFASRRHYSTATEEVDTSSELPAINEYDAPPKAANVPHYEAHAAVILTRGPIITKELTPFEKEYFQYQRRLADEISSPFPVDFYFKKGSLAEKRWLAAAEARKKGVAAVQAPTQEEIERGAPTGSERVFEEEAGLGEKLAQPRQTDADKKNDITALDRKLDQNLYLLVKEKDVWRFPYGPVGAVEALHETAARRLDETCGVDMNTWFVSRHPVGAMKFKFRSPVAGPKFSYVGRRTFFLRGRIFAGQVKLSNEYQEFAWLTKDEIKERVSQTYWDGVGAMLI